MIPFDILDATAGGRMLWQDKARPRTLYVDRRIEPPGTIPIRPNWSVQPDVVASFTALPFADGSFKMVVFDPPHIVRVTPSKGYMRTKYGELGADWKEVLRAGFRECWRVLRQDGTLVLKWGGADVPAGEVLKLRPVAPLFKCLPQGKEGTTWWHFLKGPDVEPAELVDDLFAVAG